MPRVAFGLDQRVEYKLLDFKKWVLEQMARNGINQDDLGKAIGASQGQVSQMLKIPKKKGERIKSDLFTLGQVLILFDLFEADEKTKKNLL